MNIKKEKKHPLAEIIGWYGTIAVISAYMLVSFDFINVDSFIYMSLNLTGALGIITITYIKKAYQPLVLNIVWAIIAIIAILAAL